MTVVFVVLRSDVENDQDDSWGPVFANREHADRYATDVAAELDYLGRPKGERWDFDVEEWTVHSGPRVPLAVLHLSALRSAGWATRETVGTPTVEQGYHMDDRSTSQHVWVAGTNHAVVRARFAVLLAAARITPAA